MLTKKVTDDDNFMSLSASAQALYLHLNMSADDDGFNNQVTISMFKAHASIDDLKSLLEKRYVYQFENGVIVIKHWRMANALRKDRYTPTAFQEELKQLNLKDNGSYSLVGGNTAEVEVVGCHLVATDKDRLDKNRIGKDNVCESKRFTIPTIEQIQSYIDEKGYSVDAERFFDFYESKGWMVGKNKMKDWKACIRGWHSKDKPKEFKPYEINVEELSPDEIRKRLYAKESVDEIRQRLFGNEKKVYTLDDMNVEEADISSIREKMFSNKKKGDSNV